MEPDEIELLNRTLRGEMLLLEAYRHASHEDQEHSARLLLEECTHLVEERVERLVRRIQELGGTPAIAHP